MSVFLIILISLLALGMAVGLVVLISYIITKKQSLSAEEMYIKNLLPGIDCGVCGCKTCAEFAKKVTNGERKPEECKVNSFVNYQKLKRHLVSDVNTSVADVAFVKCKGGSKCTNKYDYLGEISCDACDNMHSGNKSCKAACLGCGDCVQACKFDAISISKRGTAVVDPMKCTGCEQCVKSCPNDLIVMLPVTQKVAPCCNNTYDDEGIVQKCKVGCIRCEACVRACPSGAITMQNGLPVIDSAKCINCGKCVAACPTHVITHI